MSDLTINEKVVCRLIEAAWRQYLDLPPERRGEALEFRRKLDEAAAVIKMRPAHRAGAEVGVAIEHVDGRDPTNPFAPTEQFIARSPR